MKITNVAIRFRTSVLVLTALIMLGGAWAYVALPKESNPSIEIPNIVITTVYPGASPPDVEHLITQPIEQELQSISGVKEIRSTSTEGVSSVVVEFNPDVDLSEANQKVREKVDLAKPELPADAEEPIIAEIDLSEFPIMNINLAGDYPLARLKQVAEDLADELEAISSVLEVIVVGGVDREVQVNVDLNRLQAYNLSLHDVVETIRKENTNIPGGSVDVDHLNYLVRVDGVFDTPAEIRDLVVKAPSGQPIYIRDVAEVVFGFKERRSYSRLRIVRRDGPRGRPIETGQAAYRKVITLSVKKRSGENILETAAQIQQVLDAFPTPTGTQILITGDQSEMVDLLVKDLENNIISGLIFVVVVLLFFLGLRTSLLVGVAIPLSMGVSFMVFMALGYTLNFIILFSLIIALGMLVDNAVVLVENIYRFLEEGHGHFEAARLATAEVGMAVAVSTATTVAVFVPMLFWPGIIGEFMSFLPLTLIITLSCSLFVALIINPVLTGYFARVEGHRVGKTSRWALWITIAALAWGAAALALSNLNALLVLGGGAVGLTILHLLLLKPIASYFVHVGLPRLVAIYRRFLQIMLERDYQGRAAYWRNMTGLVSLASGLALAVTGGVVFAVAGTPAAWLFLGPAGVLFGLGAAGVVLHSLEVLLVGGGQSVKLGVLFGLVMGGVLGAMYLTGGAPPPHTVVGLLGLPALVVSCGILGWPLRGRRLILTDNRARLMNLTLGGLAAIVAVFVISKTGVEFFPQTDPSQISVSVQAPLGTNLESSNRVAKIAQARVDALLAKNPISERNVESVLVNVGVGGGTMFGAGSFRPESSQTTLKLVDFQYRAESSQLTMTKLRQQLEGITNAEVELKRDQHGPPTGPPVNIEISGPKFEQIVRISNEVKAKLVRAAETGQIPALVDIRDNLDTGRPEMAVRIDRERAARFGLDTQKIAGMIRTAINGNKASTFRDGEDEYDITVRLAEIDRGSLESVRNLNVMNEGDQIPLVAVAEFDVGSGLGSITRKDLQRVVTVEGGVEEGHNAKAVLQEVQALLAPYEKALPPGYTMKYTGESKDQEESFSFLTTALITGSTLIMMILIAEFNSVLTPFIIMIAVALSMIGVLLGMVITRTAFSLFTFIGVISLAGIVVNNNIVLIDYTRQLRERGRSKRLAIVEAGAVRLRPVLLTALTTVLGLIPLTFGINIDFVGLLTDLQPDFRIGSENTQFWGPMGTAIIAGLTFATFLTLVIVPVMYSLLDSAATGLAEKLRREPLDEPQAGEDPLRRLVQAVEGPGAEHVGGGEQGQHDPAAEPA